MKGYITNIEKETLENENFRRVLYTAKHSQLVLMSLKPKEEIGSETHEHNDQFLRFEAGHGKVLLDDNEYEVRNGDAVIVPAGSKHNVVNTSDTEALKLYTVYSPPDHKDGIVHITKEDAKNDVEFDGETTEGVLL
jgi:mannose-6-phosphate isomerase-like protein (cupin superfamily)